MFRKLALFLVATFAVVANAQSIRGLMPGPYAERDARQAYAPVDRIIGAIGPGGYFGGGYGGYYPGGYGYYGGQLGVSALVGGIAGLGGGLIANALSNHNDRDRTEYIRTPDGGGRVYYTSNYGKGEPQRRQVVFAASKPQKPLDCHKPRGKRGRNEAACAEAELELAAQREAVVHQACLGQLDTSHWRIRNFSPVAVMHATLNNQPLFVCGEQVVLGPLQTIHIFPPEGQVGGYFFFAHSSGEKMRAEAEVQAVNRPGLTGFILAVPAPPKEEN